MTPQFQEFRPIVCHTYSWDFSLVIQSECPFSPCVGCVTLKTKGVVCFFYPVRTLETLDPASSACHGKQDRGHFQHNSGPVHANVQLTNHWPLHPFYPTAHLWDMAREETLRNTAFFLPLLQILFINLTSGSKRTREKSYS